MVVPRQDGFSAKYIFGLKQPFRVKDLQNPDSPAEPAPHPQILAMGVRSTLGVPIQFGGEVIGGLYAHSDEPDYFRPGHVELLEHLSNQAGVAIHNAQLYHDTRLRQQLLTAMTDQLRNIRGEREPQVLQQEIVRLATDLLNCDFGGLVRNRPASEEIELLVSWQFQSHTVPILTPYGVGVIGKTAAGGQPAIKNHCTDADLDIVLKREGVSALLAVPFLSGAEVEAVLFVGRRVGKNSFDGYDLEILVRFAETSAEAWRTSQLLSQEQRSVLKIKTLYQISDYLRKTRDLYCIYHAALTGITANFGLGFNRAALLMLDEERRLLVGKMGIGELDLEHARRGWENNLAQGLHEFPRYLEALEAGKIGKTLVEERICELSIPYDRRWAGLLYTVIERGTREIVDKPKKLQQLPRVFVEAFAPDTPLAIVALRVGNKATGLLIVDNKYSKTPITDEDIDALKTFANTLAITVNNALLFEQTDAAEREVRALFEASNFLLSGLDAAEILDRIAEQARGATGAQSVSAVLIDENGQAQAMATAGDLQGSAAHEVIRPDGLSMQVFTSGKYEKFENASEERERVNQTVFERHISAGLCLPLKLEKKTIGVIWYHYGKPRPFLPHQINTYQLYANQAVLAWDIAQRIQRLERLREAADAMAGVREADEILQRIVEWAHRILGADSVALWPYDGQADEFMPDMARQIGLADDLWSEMCKEPRLRGGTGSRIMREGWVGVADLDDSERCGFVSERCRQMLVAAGVRSFQGVALQAGEETLGILYANYARQREFTRTEALELQNFARHAALVLQNASLLSQLQKEYKGARTAARVTILQEDLQNTLNSLVFGAKDVLDCDAVTLYAYDQNSKELRYPPAMVGVRYPEPVLESSNARSDSIIYQIMDMGDLYWSSDAKRDAVFSEGGFARREDIKAAAGAPLIASGRCVGVLFANYRRRHRFDERDLDDIRLYADFAAANIYNAQLYTSLKQMRGLVGSRTATEWMRMVSLQWGHAIRREVATALGHLTLLKLQLQATGCSAKISEELNALKATLEGIGETPILAPLSAEDGIEAVDINDLVSAHVKAKRRNDRLADIMFIENLASDLDGKALVRASRPWLRQAFDMMIDNAVGAMRTGQTVNKKLTITTALVGRYVEISFKDSGPGVSPDLIPKLFREPIRKSEGSSGAGLGLIEAQAIAATYEGDISLRATGEDGSDFVLVMPVA